MKWKNYYKYIILFLFSLFSIIFVYNDYFLYQTPILKVLDIHEEVYNGAMSDEVYYKQNIKGVIKNETLRKLADIAAWCLMVVIVVARLISGVHWLSDILGGIIISLTYLSLLKLSLLRMDAKDLTTA